MRWCLFLFLFPAWLIAEPEIDLYVLTYPRSGTHWIARIIKTVCAPSVRKNRATHLIHSFASHDEVEKSIGRDMNVASIEVKKNQGHLLLLLIRNYKESMLRHFDEDPVRVLSHLEDDSGDIAQLKFFSNLQKFDEWDPSRKLLVYYEDLLTSPQEEIKRIITFLGGDIRELDRFMDIYEQHKNEEVIAYDKMPEKYNRRGSVTRGNDLLYHSKMVPLDMLRMMDQLAYNRSPILYKKYLKRYQTLY